MKNILKLRKKSDSALKFFLSEMEELINNASRLIKKSICKININKDEIRFFTNTYLNDSINFENYRLLILLIRKLCFI